MNRLQRLRTVRDYIVTLNPVEPVPAEAVIDRTTLTHPLYSFETLATQEKLAARNGARRTWFCGSYLGYGFHEDAVRSAVAVARGLGVDW
jgi:predicted NAD/FAD-binding protein